jgi:hypothetical protein
MDERSRAIVQSLVEFIFGDRYTRQKPQGVFHRHHADYWERFASIPRLEDSQRDQEVLRTIMAADGGAL